MNDMTMKVLHKDLENVSHVDDIGLLMSLHKLALSKSEPTKSIENRIAELLPSKLPTIYDIDTMVFIWITIPMRVGLYYSVEERFAEVLSSKLSTVTDVDKLRLLLEITMGSSMAGSVMDRIAELEQRQL